MPDPGNPALYQINTAVAGEVARELQRVPAARPRRQLKYGREADAEGLKSFRRGRIWRASTSMTSTSQ
jgi:hypothetical protein